MAKVQFIKKWCVDNGYTYKKILNDDSITKIYELLNSNFIVPFEIIEFCYYGSYYKEQKDYVNMKKYYLMAIEKGHCEAMNNYIKYSKDYKLAYKYKSKLNNENKKLLEEYLSLCAQYLNNKMELTKDQCCVCLEDKYLQPFINCSHGLCDTCYAKVNKCPLCRQHKIQRLN